ncbi:MAG: vWA domain-containing protein [Paracoccaceae bacterium]
MPRFLLPLALVLGAGLATAQTMPSVPLPPFEDPFAPPGTPVDCAGVEPRERAKVGCGEAGGGESDGTGDDAFASGPEAATGAPRTDPGAGGGDPPLAREDLPDLAQRVLSLPGAALAPEPGGQAGEALPAFTVFYVYERREEGGATWLKLGRSAFGEIDGWLKADDVEDWRTMLVMQYAPKGARGRVLFFKRRDDLADFVADQYAAQETEYAYETIEAGENDGDYFVAIEPALAVDDERLYLMPVLSHDTEFSALGERVRLLEVAGLNADATAAVQRDVTETESRSAPRRAGAYRHFRLGVTFVIDTTRSMGPYIDHTRAIVGSTLAALREAGQGEAFTVGLVGFRDTTSQDAGVGYTAKVYQPLDPEADVEEVADNFSLMAPSTASTPGFSEDVYAGLHTALNTLDWEPYALRLVVLVTDAAPRPESDPLAAHPGYGALSVIEDARRQNVALAVVHLLTPNGLASGNVNEALPVYREIAATGDSAFSKYLAVDTADTTAFERQVERFQAGLIDAVSTLSRGRPVERTEEAAQASDLGEVLVNEVFRAQLEYLGAERGQDAPRFYRAWAADRDLADPRLEALDVRVFLTRNQLAALDKGVRSILDAYLSKETGGGDFFDAMQAIAAETSVEGGRRGDLERAGELLPSFLEALPYRSEFLALDERQWSALGPSGQRQKIESLRDKLSAYEARAEARDGWIDLGAGDRGLEVHPLSLNLLP